MTEAERIQHTAVLREAQLAASLIGRGVHALSNASHDKVGLYHEAFFGLSNGIERLCKLNYIADYAITKNGKFPKFEELKKQGHNISKLLGICGVIAQKYDQSQQYIQRPNSRIHTNIENVLTEFAKSTRYYNLDYLTKPINHSVDPVSKWWSDVGVLICDEHYKPERRQQDEAVATALGARLDGISMVLHTAETGEHIDSAAELLRRQKAGEIVQAYGRMYTLQIVRWLGAITFELSHEGAYGKRIAALRGFHEPFSMFHNRDGYLRKRKTWPLY